MKYILAVLMILSMVGAQAAQVTIDQSKLTAEQQAALATLMQSPQAPTVEKMDAILSRIERFGEGAARGVVAFAKELGVAANDFIQTPMGVATAIGMIAYFAGKSIIGFFIGCFFLFVMFPIAVTNMFKHARPRKVVKEYTTIPVLFGLFTRDIPTKISTEPAFQRESDSFVMFLYIVSTIISLGIGIGFIS